MKDTKVKKQKKRPFLKKFLKRLGVVMIIFEFTIIFSMMLFFINEGHEYYAAGKHNIDLGYNFEIMNAKYDMGIEDIGSDYVRRTPMQLYITGFNQVRKGVKFLCAGFLLAGIVFVHLLHGVVRIVKS